MKHQILPKDYNSYGARRGNHEVMMRGTFANIRIRNEMVPGTEGGFTTLYPEKKVMPIYDAVVVIGYLDQGGKGIIQASLDSGAFDRFILSDGMIGQSLVDAFGKDLRKSFGSMPGSTGKGAGVFAGVAKAAGIDSSGPYTGESYDAAALIILAMQAGNSTDRASIAKNVMDVANGPGTKIYPGELKKGLDLLAKGKKVDYEGATGVTFTSVGEAEGSFLEQEVKGGKFKTKKQR